MSGVTSTACHERMHSACGGSSACACLCHAVEQGFEAAQLLDEIRAAYKMSSEYLDRFRDVVAEVTGHGDNNPGDDVLIADLRSMHGKTGPEPRRWRDFLVGAVAQLDQIDAMRKSEDLEPSS